ncbi:putative WAHD domain of WASH complex [Leishmania utingensis]|uniref:WAHD domain of WASH complex n=1 Tax=Leishmania utingensis TaxID=653362 RepID=A0AAW3AZC3_9TRYP
MATPAAAVVATSEVMDSGNSDDAQTSSSLNSRSSSVDSARAVAAARAYDTAAIAIIPGLVVPLTSASSQGGCAALASAVASLQALADTVGIVLDRLDRAAASQQRRLNAVQGRICTCAGFVDRLRGRRTATLLESKPRYPQPVPLKSRGGGRAKAAKSKWDAQGNANDAAAAILSGVPSALSTAHSHRFLRPRRSSPLPPVAPSSCSESSTDDSGDDASQQPHPPSYQAPMRTVPAVPALTAPERATATAHHVLVRRGDSVSDFSRPLPPVNPVAAMRLAESMPLETVLLEGEDSNAVLVGNGGRGEATTGHVNERSTLTNAASSLPASSSSALAWQPRSLPVMRNGQTMHNAGEMPRTLSALVSFPAHQMAYRHLAAANSSFGGNVGSVIASVQHGALLHSDAYSPARRTTTAWLHSASMVEIELDFTTPLQAQQYAFVPGGDAAAASSRALLRDMPRNLPLRHLATVRRWDHGGGDQKPRIGGSTGSEDDVDDGVEEREDDSSPRWQRRTSRRDPRDLETIAPSQQQRQRRAHRRHTLGDDGTVSEGSDDTAEGVTSARHRGRESGRARPKQQQTCETSTQPTAAAPSTLPPAPLLQAPPPPPGVTRSTTAPPPPPLPQAALLQGKANPPMFPLGSGGGAPQRLPPPPPPPPPNFSAELRSAVGSRPPPPVTQVKMAPPPSSTAPPPPPLPPPPPPTLSQLPVGVKPDGGRPVVAPPVQRVPPPPPPPPPSSQKPAVSALTSMLGERRRVLHGDDSSSTGSDSGFSNKNTAAHGKQADSPDSLSSSTSPRANPTVRGRLVNSAVQRLPPPPQLASSSSSDDESDW